MPRLTTRANVRRAFVISACVVSLALGLAPWAPAVPAAPAITSPVSGAVLAGLSGSRTVSFAGTAPSGATVELFEGASSLGTATADTGDGSTGAWTAAASFVSGEHSVFAVATDAAAIASPASDAVTFTVDDKRPNVSISAPEDNFVYKPGEAVEIAGRATDNIGVFAVRLEYWRVDKLAFRSLATCDDCGAGATSAEWTHTPVLGQPGVYQVKAEAIDLAGISSTKPARTFVTTEVVAPTVTPPEGTPAPPEITAPDPGSIQPGAQPTTFSGTAPSGSKVTLVETLQGLGTIGTTETSVGDGTTGVWKLRFMLTEGTYGVQARTTSLNGWVGELGALVAFSVDSSAPGLTVATQNPVVFLPGQPVELTGTITDNFRTAAVQIEYWFLDQLVLRDYAACRGCGTSSATWTHRPSLSRPGNYYVKVSAIDVAGNKSPAQSLTIVTTV
jgi:large repetitive protein